MTLTEMFLAELEREAAGTRRALERVPEGRNDWKPHAKSMELGYLASLIAIMPSWITMMVEQDEFDLKGPGAEQFRSSGNWKSRGELTSALDQGVAKAKAALQKTNDAHLMKNWRFKVGGHVVNEAPRHIMIRDSVFSHLAHHRGQLTVYLRLNEAVVPALYGPSADEGKFQASAS